MKLLFVNNNMHMGGVQKALCNLLWQLHERHDITLLLFQKKGVLLEQLPADIKIMEVASDYRYLGMRRDEGSLFRRNTYALLTRIFGRRTAIALMKQRQGEISGYDVVISYLHNGRRNGFYGGCADFVENHVKGKKIAVIHGDLRHCGSVDQGDYAGFDRIACCSEGCRESLNALFPQLIKRSAVLPNCHNFEQVKAQSMMERVLWDSKNIHVLTVARLAPEKALLRALRALIDSGRADIHYHIIGEGKERAALESFIKENGLSKRVTLHGERTNPYPWIKSADVLLIPSYHEAAPLVIGEAACLGTAILSTETCSAKELIKEKGYGWVCGNNKESLEEAFRTLTRDMVQKQNEKLRVLNLSDEQAVSTFEQMLEELYGNE